MVPTITITELAPWPSQVLELSLDDTPPISSNLNVEIVYAHSLAGIGALSVLPPGVDDDSFALTQLQDDDNDYIISTSSSSDWPSEWPSPWRWTMETTTDGTGGSGVIVLEDRGYSQNKYIFATRLFPKVVECIDSRHIRVQMMLSQPIVLESARNWSRTISNDNLLKTLESGASNGTQYVWYAYNKTGDALILDQEIEISSAVASVSSVNGGPTDVDTSEVTGNVTFDWWSTQDDIVEIYSPNLPVYCLCFGGEPITETTMDPNDPELPFWPEQVVTDLSLFIPSANIVYVPSDNSVVVTPQYTIENNNQCIVDVDAATMVVFNATIDEPELWTFTVTVGEQDPVSYILGTQVPGNNVLTATLNTMADGPRNIQFDLTLIHPGDCREQEEWSSRPVLTSPNGDSNIRQLVVVDPTNEQGACFPDCSFFAIGQQSFVGIDWLPEDQISWSITPTSSDIQFRHLEYGEVDNNPSGTFEDGWNQISICNLWFEQYTVQASINNGAFIYQTELQATTWPKDTRVAVNIDYSNITTPCESVNYSIPAKVILSNSQQVFDPPIPNLSIIWSAETFPDFGADGEIWLEDSLGQRYEVGQQIDYNILNQANIIFETPTTEFPQVYEVEIYALVIHSSYGALNTNVWNPGLTEFFLASRPDKNEVKYTVRYESCDGPILASQDNPADIVLTADQQHTLCITNEGDEIHPCDQVIVYASCMQWKAGGTGQCCSTWQLAQSDCGPCGGDSPLICLDWAEPQDIELFKERYNCTEPGTSEPIIPTDGSNIFWNECISFADLCISWPPCDVCGEVGWPCSGEWPTCGAVLSWEDWVCQTLWPCDWCQYDKFTDWPCIPPDCQPPPPQIPPGDWPCVSWYGFVDSACGGCRTWLAPAAASRLQPQIGPLPFTKDTTTFDLQSSGGRSLILRPYTCYSPQPNWQRLTGPCMTIHFVDGFYQSLGFDLTIDSSKEHVAGFTETGAVSALRGCECLPINIQATNDECFDRFDYRWEDREIASVRDRQQDMCITPGEDTYVVVTGYSFANELLFQQCPPNRFSVDKNGIPANNPYQAVKEIQWVIPYTYSPELSANLLPIEQTTQAYDIEDDLFVLEVDTRNYVMQTLGYLIPEQYTLCDSEVVYTITRDTENIPDQTFTGALVGTGQRYFGNIEETFQTSTPGDVRYIDPESPTTFLISLAGTYSYRLDGETCCQQFDIETEPIQVTLVPDETSIEIFSPRCSFCAGEPATFQNLSQRNVDESLLPFVYQSFVVTINDGSQSQLYSRGEDLTITFSEPGTFNITVQGYSETSGQGVLLDTAVFGPYVVRDCSDNAQLDQVRSFDEPIQLLCSCESFFVPNERLSAGVFNQLVDKVCKNLEYLKFMSTGYSVNLPLCFVGWYGRLSQKCPQWHSTALTKYQWSQHNPMASIVGACSNDQFTDIKQTMWSRQYCYILEGNEIKIYRNDFQLTKINSTSTITYGVDFVDPVSMALNSDGQLIVVDRVLNGLYTFAIDVNDPQAILALDKSIVGIGDQDNTTAFNNPTQMRLGQDDRIYVVDQGNAVIKVFSKQLNWLFNITNDQWTTAANNLYNVPVSVAIDGDNYVYVLSSTNNIYVFDQNQQLTNQFEVESSVTNIQCHPIHKAVVTTFGNDRPLRYNRRGTRLGIFYEPQDIGTVVDAAYDGYDLFMTTSNTSPDGQQYSLIFHVIDEMQEITVWDEDVQSIMHPCSCMHLDEDQLLSDWAINGSLEMLWDNYALFDLSIHSKFANFADGPQPVPVERPITFDRPPERLVGINEPVTAEVLYRVFLCLCEYGEFLIPKIDKTSSEGLCGDVFCWSVKSMIGPDEPSNRRCFNNPVSYFELEGARGDIGFSKKMRDAFSCVLIDTQRQ